VLSKLWFGASKLVSNLLIFDPNSVRPLFNKFLVWQP